MVIRLFKIDWLKKLVKVWNKFIKKLLKLRGNLWNI